MGAVHIYSLSDPETGRVRYIGKAKDPQQRIKTHVSDSRRARTSNVKRWVKGLVEQNLWPVMHVLLETDDENWQREETRLIAEYRATHSDLLNIADGGAAPYMSKPQRAKNGRTAAQARVKTPRDAEIYRIKTEIGKGLKWLEKYSPDGYVRLVEKIRPLAVEYPGFFGVWAHL